MAQKEIRDEYFEMAIKNNTTINSSTQSGVLTHFFDYNAQLTSANRSERLHLKLVKFGILMKLNLLKNIMMKWGSQ